MALEEAPIDWLSAFRLDLLPDPRLLTAGLAASSLLERVDRVEAGFALSTGAGVVTLLVKGVE